MGRICAFVGESRLFGGELVNMDHGTVAQAQLAASSNAASNLFR